ncbi:MAG TPA: hypothetical protein VHD83_23495 [Puia sp.]|nr:hypothetical protein [Puia sp.]
MTNLFSSLAWPCLLASVSLVCLPACQSQPSANLLLNGDAEMPPSDSTPHGWKNVQGHWKEVEGDTASHIYAWAEEGKQHFFEGQDLDGVMEQDIDVQPYAAAIDAHKQQAIFHGSVCAFPQSPADQSQIIVSCLADSLGKPLYVYNSDTISSIGKWQALNDTFMIPASTRLIRISLMAHRRNGADNDGYFDDIRFTTRQTGFVLNKLVIILAGIVLCIIAGLSYWFIRRRRSQQQTSPLKPVS